MARTSERSHLSGAQRAELGRRLEAERRRLLDRYQKSVEREGLLPSGEAEDFGDRGGESLAREEIFAERQTERAELLRVEEALERLEGGTYGRCSYCGAPIPLERLEAVPATRYCAAHQELLETGEFDERRPYAWPPGERES